VLSRDFIFAAPRVLTVPPKGGIVPVEIEFMANKLLKGDLGVKGSTLELAGRVIDTAVKIDERSPWTASVIELFIRPARSEAVTSQFFLLPRVKGATVFDKSRKPAKSAGFKVKIDKGGYDFALKLDLTKAGVKAGDAFYLDFIVSAGALGDAHGACRVGWNGKTNSASSSGHFALVTMQS
jgi:alpha-galactosidase